MVQSSRSLEGHICRRTQANEFDHALGSGKLVSRLAACPDLGPSSASGHCRNALAATEQRNLEIGHEFCRDDSRKSRDLLSTRSLQLNRLDDSPQAGTGVRHPTIEFT